MDLAIVERARRGDSEAFDMLVRDGMPAVYRRSLAILGSEADARDAAQETFVAAWRELPRLREIDRFEAWLARICLNACRMALRKRGRVREIQVVDGFDPPGRDRVGALAEVDVIRRSFGRLPLDQRTILVLHHLEGRPLTEIAAVLDVPLGTVKSRLHGARRALEAALAAEGAA